MLFILLIFMPDFPLGRVTGATSIGEVKIPLSQQQFQIVLLDPHQDETQERLKMLVIPPRSWKTSEPLSCGFNQQGLPPQSFIGHSGCMTKLM